MKKILAVFVALMMILCLASCGKQGPKATLKVVDLDGNTLYTIEVNVEDGKTAGEELEAYLTENKIDYEIYDGDMIAKIGDLSQNAETWDPYWAIYVNGEYGQVSLWEQTFSEGDVVEVRLEHPNW